MALSAWCIWMFWNKALNECGFTLERIWWEIWDNLLIVDFGKSEPNWRSCWDLRVFFSSEQQLRTEKVSLLILSLSGRNIWICNYAHVVPIWLTLFCRKDKDPDIQCEKCSWSPFPLPPIWKYYKISLLLIHHLMLSVRNGLKFKIWKSFWISFTFSNQFWCQWFWCVS